MPSLVAKYESVWNTSTQPKTASVSVNAGDVLVIFGTTEEAGSTTLSTPTGGGLTYTLQRSVTTSAYTAMYAWTATAASTQTYTLSIGGATVGFWGFNCHRYSGASGIGATAVTNASGAPSLAITTTGANSAIAVGNGDWNAADGASRSPRSIGSGSFTEQTYFRDASHYTVYNGFYTDSGTIGAKTVGWSAPAGQKYAIIAVELLASGGAAATSQPPVASPWRRRLPLLVR